VTDTFIRAVAAEVKGHGKKYETTLKERERNNPKYSFMLRRDHRRHAFYKGLIESERDLEPEFDDEGYNSVYSTDSAEESERERVPKTRLGKLARKRFEAMLRSLSGKRGEIARCMTFCLEHAEAAHEVADIIVASLLVDWTAVPRKVARLHLICDILHNSAASVPSAWKFRPEFQSRLGIVFDHLSNIYHSFPGRITAETFKKQITGIVDIWEDWIVFPPDFTSHLRMRLDGATTEPEKKAEEIPSASQSNTDSFASRFKPSTFQLATEPVKAEVSTSADVGEEEPMEMDSDTEKAPAVDDIDGEAVDVDGVPVNDIDGEPADIDDDVDGVPVNDDIDGIPFDDFADDT
jgi:U2-associated protein SR140